MATRGSAEAKWGDVKDIVRFSTACAVRTQLDSGKDFWTPALIGHASKDKGGAKRRMTYLQVSSGLDACHDSGLCRIPLILTTVVIHLDECVRTEEQPRQKPLGERGRTAPATRSR
jgi:hypothetical protein